MGDLMKQFKNYEENELEIVALRTYYNKNVRNVGDILFEITSMMSNTLTKYSKEEYQKFISAVPFINTDYIQVTQINKHLNDSTTIKNIRSLYSQKKNDKMALAEIQSKIDEINEKLDEYKNGDDIVVYSWRLVESDPYIAGRKKDIALREKIKELQKELIGEIGIGKNRMTLNDLFDRYMRTKKRLSIMYSKSIPLATI
mgnify:CR=1 FL=1